MNAPLAASAEYNSRFWYPRSGGIEVLVKGLQGNLSPIHSLQEVITINTANRTVYTRTGTSWKWDVLVSSIPLPELCNKTGDEELIHYARNLSNSATVVFNIGTRSPLIQELSGVHWIYIPDRSIPFYRVGFYSNINQGMCLPQSSSLYIEVGIPGTDIDTINIIQDIQPGVLSALAQLGWVKSEDIMTSVVHIIRYAYVHHTIKREQTIEKIFKRLAQFGIYPIGRYGMWDYISMEDSIVSSIDTIKKLI
jgi:protoporphyrinogen oxidase